MFGLKLACGRFVDEFDPYLSRKGFVSFNSSNEDSPGKVFGGSKSIADAAADVFPSLVVLDVPASMLQFDANN